MIHVVCFSIPCRNVQRKFEQGIQLNHIRRPILPGQDPICWIEIAVRLVNWSNGCADRIALEPLLAKQKPKPLLVIARRFGKRPGRHGGAYVCGANRTVGNSGSVGK